MCSLTQVWRGGLVWRLTVSDMLLVGMGFTSHSSAAGMMDSTHTNTHTHWSPQRELFQLRDLQDINDPRCPRNTLQWVHSFMLSALTSLLFLFLFLFLPPAPLPPLSFCQHHTALPHVIFKFLIMHNTKGDPSLTSTNTTVWVYLTIINMFSWFGEAIPCTPREWM